MSMTAPLMDTTAAANLLGLPSQTLRQWRCAGLGPDYIKLGSGRMAAVRYTVDDIHRYIDEHRRVGAVRAFAENNNERF